MVSRFWLSSKPASGEITIRQRHPRAILRLTLLTIIWDLTSHLTSHTMTSRECSMTKWQLQEAKALFSELIDNTLEKGPQVVRLRGSDRAVAVCICAWSVLKEGTTWITVEVVLQE